MNDLPSLLSLTLSVLIGASASSSPALSAENVQRQPREPVSVQRVVVDHTGHWLRVSQDTPHGLYLSLPAQRWGF